VSEDSILLLLSFLYYEKDQTERERERETYRNSRVCKIIKERSGYIYRTYYTYRYTDSSIVLLLWWWTLAFKSVGDRKKKTIVLYTKREREKNEGALRVCV